MARYHGKKGLVYIAPTGTGVAVSVGALSAWSADFAVDKVDVTSFGDTNKNNVVGLRNAQGTLAGFWDDTIDGLYAACEVGEAVRMYLYPSSDVLTKYWYGTAFPDFSIDTSVSGAVAVSGNWTGASTWARK